MADYHPLIARAVDGLGTSTGEARRALYERARAALVAQLRSIEPPLSEADITRERLALEPGVPTRQLLKPQEGLLGNAIRARQGLRVYWNGRRRPRSGSRQGQSFFPGRARLLLFRKSRPCCSLPHRGGGGRPLTT